MMGPGSATKDLCTGLFPLALPCPAGHAPPCRPVEGLSVWPALSRDPRGPSGPKSASDGPGAGYGLVLRSGGEDALGRCIQLSEGVVRRGTVPRLSAPSMEFGGQRLFPPWGVVSLAGQGRGSVLRSAWG